MKVTLLFNITVEGYLLTLHRDLMVAFWPAKLGHIVVEVFSKSLSLISEVIMRMRI